VRLIGRLGFAAATLFLVAGSARQATASPAHARVPSVGASSNFVLATGSGPDFHIESASTGALDKDLGAVQGWTNNGLALSPDGQYVYVVVNRATTLAIERLSVSTGAETFVAEGEQPAVSPNSRLLAFGSGPSGSNTLVVRDLTSGKNQSVDLRRLLGGRADLLNASITWLGDGSEVVVLPGGVGNDLMGGPTPRAVPGSCDAVSANDTCLIVVSVRSGHPLKAKRVILSGLKYSDVIGASGSSGLVTTAFDARHNAVYHADLAGGASSVIRLFSLPSVLPLTFGAQGTTLFYLVGHGPEALWTAKVTPDGLKDAHMLNANVALSALAS
jgi:hypothetical protein